MDLEELFDRRHHHRGTRGHDGRHEEDYDYRGRYQDHHDRGFADIHSLARRLLRSKRLLVVAGILGLVVVAILISLMVLIFPLFSALWGYVERDGLKGVIEAILAIIQQFWEGKG